MKRSFLVVAMVAVATAASAQTKIAGTLQCGKRDIQQKIDVGDRPGHAFAISQGKCTWTKPIEVAGTQTKEDLVTDFGEISGNTSRGRFVAVIQTTGADKIHVGGTNTATLKDGLLQSGEGKWQFTAGTGKLKGIKGQGTFKCKGAGETETCEVEGEYQLPK